VKGVQGQVKAEPMTLVTGDEKYARFDCKPCEMHIIGAMKKHTAIAATIVCALQPYGVSQNRPAAN
jgi:putative protease